MPRYWHRNRLQDLDEPSIVAVGQLNQSPSSPNLCRYHRLQQKRVAVADPARPQNKNLSSRRHGTSQLKIALLQQTIHFKVEGAHHLQKLALPSAAERP